MKGERIQSVIDAIAETIGQDEARAFVEAARNVIDSALVASLKPEELRKPADKLAGLHASAEWRAGLVASVELLLALHETAPVKQPAAEENEERPRGAPAATEPDSVEHQRATRRRQGPEN